MTISLERPSEDEVAYFNNIIRNAKRLAFDARILIEHDRPQSAIMLAVFAIEELGKALITAWGIRNEGNARAFPSHIEKQSATFSLLSAIEATRMTKIRLKRKLEKDNFSFHTLGPLSSQFAHARAGFFDDVRMVVTYADQNPKLAVHKLEDGFTAGLAAELLDWFELAGESIATNGPAMELASTIYQNDLGRM